MKGIYCYLFVRAVLLLRMEPLEFSIVLRATSVLLRTCQVRKREGGKGGNPREDGKNERCMVHTMCPHT